jgi:putative ABC transport system permease protein
MSLRHYTWRAMQQRPGRAVLTMLSVVIGVTAAVATGLGTATTRNAYKQMFAMVTGRATLEVDAAGGSGFDQNVFSRIASSPDVAAATPLVDRPSSISMEGGERQVRIEVLGIDPERDATVRDYQITQGRQVKEGDEVVLDEQFAKFLGLAVGDEVKIRTKRFKMFKIVGLVRPKTAAFTAQSAMAFMPIKQAQLSFNPAGRQDLIDKIQIITRPDVDPLKVEPQIAQAIDTVTLTATRDDKTINIDVRLARPAARLSAAEVSKIAIEALGVEGEDAENGARLTKVAENSPAARAGLAAGDVITKFDGDTVKSFDALSGLVNNRLAVNVHRPSANTQLMQETLLSTEQGLTLTTLFSLLMASFIILNTFLMNVSERRRQFSIMRAIGATKPQIGWMLLGESIVLGIIGTVLGIGLGVLLAYIGTNLIGSAFDVQFPHLREVATPWPFIVGAVFGMVMAIVGAIVPAWLATQVSPLEGMNRVTTVRKWDFTRVFLVVGLILTIGSLALIFGSITGQFPMQGATYCGVTLLIGLVMLDTTMLDPQCSLVAWILRFFSRVEAGMALRQVLRNHMRSALTIAVLFIAGSTGVGMASSIVDCVNDVHKWLQQAITADYIIRGLMPDMATGTSPDLPAALGDDLRSIPGVHVDEVAFVNAQVLRSAADPSDTLNVIAVARLFNDTRHPPSFDLYSGDPDKLREQIHAGEVVIGSVLAQKLNLKLGDKLPLETRQGVRQIPIAGVANEYMVGGLAVHMDRAHAREWLGLDRIDGYMVNADDPKVREAIRPKLEALARKYDVMLMSQHDLRKTVDRFVSGTEWSLWLLVYMGFVVAAFGVVNTLTMNVLEQTRELGLLRIVAMTKKQVRRTILMQALIIGGVGLPPGILLGVAVAYVINLAMMPSFGHPVAFKVHPDMLLSTLIGAFIIVVIAAIVPARRATRINLVEALHYE